MSIVFQTALIFQDGMVLQRDKNVIIWGTGPENRTVSAHIQNKSSSTEIHQGIWTLTIPPLTVSESEVLLLRCGEQEIILEDVAVGEVWIAGGQSNMEFFLRYDEEAESLLKREENRNIRFFDYPEVSYPGQRGERDYSKYGIWRICNPSQLEYFSAVGYHFADKLQTDLHVPVGLVGCNWGGTPACAWMDPKYLEDNAGRIWIDEYNVAVAGLNKDEYHSRFKADVCNYRNDIFSDEMGEQLMFGMSRKEQLALMDSPDFSTETNPGPLDKCRPGGLYESMVLEIAPYSARGFLWYQGESDDKHPDIYRTVFSSLIRCWRETWKEELPFLFVQLAPFRQWLHCLGEAYPIIRDEQEWVSENLPNTWFASIMDCGEKWDIHPRKKKPVGFRLALLAEGHVYGKNILCESPKLSNSKLGSRILSLCFDHGEGGLFIEGDRINALSLLINGVEVPDFEINVVGSCVHLHHENLLPGTPVEVRFAKVDYCEVNLFNIAGLPVRPFALAIGSVDRNDGKY